MVDPPKVEILPSRGRGYLEVIAGRSCRHLGGIRAPGGWERRGDTQRQQFRLRVRVVRCDLERALECRDGCGTMAEPPGHDSQAILRLSVGRVGRRGAEAGVRLVQTP